MSEHGRNLTIDERLERLTERHEALTTNVELLARENHTLKSIAESALESIKRLERIALAHQVHIDDVDERLTKLEQKHL